MTIRKLQPLAVLAALLLAGCIPGAPPSAGQPEVVDQTATPAPNPDGGIGLRFDAFDQSQVTVKVVKKKDGSGFEVSGVHGLEGKITKNAQQPLWTFSGSFTFPTAGFKIGEPFLSALGASVQDPAKDLLEYTGTVIINVPVHAPPKGALLAQMLQKIPISLQIYTSPEASFTVLLMDQ